MENITVIGGGLMGSSAAWHLSNKGERVLLLEQQGEQYTYGSSFGNSRISRSLGEREDIFTYLQNRAIQETERLIQFLNEVVKEKHQMTDIYTTSPVTYVYNKTRQAQVDALVFEGQEAIFKSASSPEEATQKLGMRIAEQDIVIREFKKYSGMLNPTALISKLHIGIKAYGNRIKYHQKIVNIQRKGAHYQIEIIHNQTGEKRKIETKKIVLAAGAYTASLLKSIAPSYQKLYLPKRMSVAFYKINKKCYDNFSTQQKTDINNVFPVFNLTGAQFYSLIDQTDAEGLPVFKTGLHQLYNEVDNFEQAWAVESSPDEVKWTKTALFDYFKMNNIPITLNDIEFYESYSCLYALDLGGTPFVGNIKIENDQVDPNFVLITAMSGIGAKGTMTYGLIAANTLLQIDVQDSMYQKTKTQLGLGDVLL